MIKGRKPSFITDEELSSIIDNESVAVNNGVPEYATYNEWQDLGYNVMKGERSYKKENGVPVFHSDQVEEINRLDYYDELDFTDYY